MTRHYFFLLFLSVASLFVGSTAQAQDFEESARQLGIEHYQLSSNLMGGGAAFFDYDNDGYEDLYLTGGQGKDRLFRNIRGERFEDVSDESGIDALITLPNFSKAVFTGDINNDGYRDIFIGRQSNHNLLFLNNGDGTFSDISESSGIANYEALTMGAVMGDYNLDGFLDIYAVNYIKVSNADNNGFYHECYPNWLFINNGDNTFTETSKSTGTADEGCALAVNFTDYNQDHRPDIYIANDFGEWILPNVMYQNNGADFSDVAEATNLNLEIYGMGIATGDFNGDGLFDYYVTNLGRNVLMQNMGNNTFSDVTTAAGVENTNAGADFSTGWGTVFVDYDHDGHQDLFVSNGQIPAAEFISTNLEDPNKAFKNNGDGTFTDVTEVLGIGDMNRGRGLAMADFDKDGDMDILFTIVENKPNHTSVNTLLYVNKAIKRPKNWLQVKLRGVAANYDGFGAKLTLYTGGKSWLRENGGGGSHASQHSAYQHFGLDDYDQIDSLVVTWPGGMTQKIENFASNQIIMIVQDEGGFFVETCVDGTCTYGNESWVYLEEATDLAVNFAGRNQGLNISWTDNATQERMYHLERASSDNPTAYTLLAALPANTTTYNDQAIEAGKEYTYRIMAIGEGEIKNSQFSAAASMMVDALPGIIMSLQCSFNGTTLENHIQWTADTTMIDSFYVERAISNSPIFAPVAKVSKENFSWNDPAIVLGQTYTYRVRSGNRFWYSDYHDEVAIVSQVTGLGNLSLLDGQISVYPNPSRGGIVKMALSGKIASKPVEVSIQDMTGRILSKQQFATSLSGSTYTQELNLGSYGVGYYLIQFKTAYGVYTTKVAYLSR